MGPHGAHTNECKLLDWVENCKKVDFQMLANNIFPFPIMFSKGLFLRLMETWDCLVKGYKATAFLKVLSLSVYIYVLTTIIPVGALLSVLSGQPVIFLNKSTSGDFHSERGSKSD